MNDYLEGKATPLASMRVAGRGTCTIRCYIEAQIVLGSDLSLEYYCGVWVNGVWAKCDYVVIDRNEVGYVDLPNIPLNLAKNTVNITAWSGQYSSEMYKGFILISAEARTDSNPGLFVYF